MDVDIWEEEFDYEIEEREVPGEWISYEDEGLQHTQEKGAKYTQSTFGRFICSGCKRKWNSAEVHVIFCMSLNRPLQQGTVKMRIFKQECKKCRFPKMEKPEISQENIVRITKNLVNRILQIFYGEKKAKQELKPEVYSKDMEGPHDKDHCEACKLMVCKWAIAAKQQIPVKSSSAQKKPKNKPQTTKKDEQCQSHGLTSSYVYTTAAKYPSAEENLHSTATYPEYESDFQSSSNKQQIAVKSSSAKKKRKKKPKTPKKDEQCQSDGLTSSNVYTTAAKCPSAEENLHATATYPEYESDFQSSSTKQQIAVKSSSAKKKCKKKSKTPKKDQQCRSDGLTSSNVYTTVAKYPDYSDYEPDFQSSSTYPYYESDFRYYSTYPNYETERNTATREKEASSFPILTSVIVGVGALALWYLRK